MNPQQKIFAQRTPCGDKRSRETPIAVNWQQQEQKIYPTTLTFSHLLLNELCDLSAAKNINNGKQQQQEATTSAFKQIIC